MMKCFTLLVPLLALSYVAAIDNETTVSYLKLGGSTADVGNLSQYYSTCSSRHFTCWLTYRSSN